MDYIFDHGVPDLLDPPLRIKQHTLQDMLERFMRWHADLLQWLLELQRHPNTIVAQRLSDLNQKQWQAERRRNKSEAQWRLRQGVRLATHRDSKKRSFDDMSATEQQVLEDLDIDKLRKQHEKLRAQKLGNLRRQML